jgi:hypothetical protein
MIRLPTMRSSHLHRPAEQRRKGMLAALKAPPSRPITLPPINAPTLAEIEAKYGPLKRYRT